MNIHRILNEVLFEEQPDNCKIQTQSSNYIHSNDSPSTTTAAAAQRLKQLSALRRRIKPRKSGGAHVKLQTN